MHVYTFADMRWDGYRLRLNSGRLLATVEPDAAWRGISDMVNLSRAKDAAITLVSAALNDRAAA